MPSLPFPHLPDSQPIIAEVGTPAALHSRGKSPGRALGQSQAQRPRQKVIPVDGSTRFETSINVWVERTLDPLSSSWRDNQACAMQNQPLLEEALKEWERLVNKPIVEWNSHSYLDQVFRYGFNSGRRLWLSDC